MKSFASVQKKHHENPLPRTGYMEGQIDNWKMEAEVMEDSTQMNYSDNIATDRSMHPVLQMITCNSGMAQELNSKPLV